MKTVLTIAGSDCSGGAGIQADIKTITAHGLYAMSVITALTAQNTLGVRGIENTPPAFVAEQLDAVFTDIFPDAVKIGMVSNAEIIGIIADKLTFYRAENIVLDPVMVSTSGCRLFAGSATQTLVDRLFPLASLITPNLSEAAALTNRQSPIETAQEMEAAAAALAQYTKGSVLVKGGHLGGDANDLLFSNGRKTWFSAPRVDNPNTHGTGCTLSSAIACGLANCLSMKDSICAAKQYLTGALSAQLDLGHGSGPLDHCYKMHLN